MMTAYLKYDLLSNKAFAVCKEYPVVVIELITVWYQQGAGFYLKEKKVSQNNNALADAFLGNCDFDPTWTLHLLLDTESLIGQLKQKMRARISRQDQNHLIWQIDKRLFIYLFI